MTLDYDYLKSSKMWSINSAIKPLPALWSYMVFSHFKVAKEFGLYSLLVSKFIIPIYMDLHISLVKHRSTSKYLLIHRCYIFYILIPELWFILMHTTQDWSIVRYLKHHWNITAHNDDIIRYTSLRLGVRRIFLFEDVSCQNARDLQSCDSLQP